MSAVKPNCHTCLHMSVSDIDHLLKQGTSAGRVRRWLLDRQARERKRHPANADALPKIPALNSIKAHARDCLDVQAIEGRASYVPPSDIPSPVPPGQQASIPLSVSAAELADPKRRLDLLREALAQRIGDLSADKLYAMYMAELKLQTAQAERDAKGGSVAAPPTPDEDGLGDAIAQAAGHLPDLRVVSGGRREVARR